MRNVVTCPSCAGTYERVQPDGSVYAHACSPVRDPSAPAPDAGSWDGEAIADRRGFVPRPDHRDENPEAARSVDGAGRFVVPVKGPRAGSPAADTPVK